MTSITPMPSTNGNHNQIDKVTSRNDLARLQDALTTIKGNKGREIETVQKQIYDLQRQSEQLQRELYVIETKERAIREAVRVMEDAGVTA